MENQATTSSTIALERKTSGCSPHPQRSGCFTIHGPMGRRRSAWGAWAAGLAALGQEVGWAGPMRSHGYCRRKEFPPRALTFEEAFVGRHLPGRAVIPQRLRCRLRQPEIAPFVRHILLGRTCTLSQDELWGSWNACLASTLACTGHVADPCWVRNISAYGADAPRATCLHCASTECGAPLRH